MKNRLNGFRIVRSFGRIFKFWVVRSFGRSARFWGFQPLARLRDCSRGGHAGKAGRANGPPGNGRKPGRGALANPSPVRIGFCQIVGTHIGLFYGYYCPLSGIEPGRKPLGAGLSSFYLLPCAFPCFCHRVELGKIVYLPALETVVIHQINGIHAFYILKNSVALEVLFI